MYVNKMPSAVRGRGTATKLWSFARCAATRGAYSRQWVACDKIVLGLDVSLSSEAPRSTLPVSFQHDLERRRVLAAHPAGAS